MTRRRSTLCKGGCGNPPRRVRHAQYCSRCWARLGRPLRECSSCGETFAVDVMQGTRCRPCVSAANHGKRIETVYGLTPGQYDELLGFQGGRCFICHRKPGAKRLAVDHQHDTGAVRGLLDKACNRDVLGHLRDDPAALQRAIDYLTLPPAKRLWPDRDIRPSE